MAELDELKAGYLRLRAITDMLANALDLDPEATVFTVNVHSPEGDKRVVQRLSLAECFSEADRLTGFNAAGDR